MIDPAAGPAPTVREEASPDGNGIAGVAPDAFRGLLEAVDEAYCVIEMILDHDGAAVDFRCLETSPAFVKHTGREMRGRRIKELVPELDQFWLDEYGKVATTGEAVRLEGSVTGFGGQWLETAATRVGGEGSRQVAVLISNVAGRKQTEAALHASEERQAFLLTLSDATRPLADPIEIQAEATRALGKRLGASRVLYAEISDDGAFFTVEREYNTGSVALVGRHRVDDYPSVIIDQLRRGDTLVIEDVEDVGLTESERAAYDRVEVCAIAAVPLIKDGRWVAALAAYEPRPRAWTPDEVALVEEVAERTWAAVERARAEDALRRSEARLKKALAIETVGVIFVDLDGAILDANDAFLRMGDYRRDTLERGGLRWDELTPAEWQAATASAVHELKTTGRATPYEKEYLRPAGSRWPALCAATMLSDREAVEFVIDLTALRAAEAAARTEHERREQAEREFVANAAHELRTPLTAIISSVDALHSGAKDDPGERDRFFVHIAREAARLNRLCDSLLLLAAVESHTPFPRAELDVREFLREIASQVRPRPGVAVQVDVELGMKIVTDRGLVERIVWNVADNAAKHTDHGSIVLSAREGELCAIIEVSDTGSGLETAGAETAFDRFSRGGSRRADGFGLGLAIARQAANVLQGELTLEPLVGGGTVARLVLPADTS